MTTRVHLGQSPWPELTAEVSQEKVAFISPPAAGSFVGGALPVDWGGSVGAALGAEYSKKPGYVYKGNRGANAALGHLLGKPFGPRVSAVLAAYGANSVPKEHELSIALRKLKKSGKRTFKAGKKSVTKFVGKNKKLSLALFWARFFL